MRVRSHQQFHLTPKLQCSPLSCNIHENGPQQRPKNISYLSLFSYSFLLTAYLNTLGNLPCRFRFLHSFIHYVPSTLLGTGLTELNSTAPGPTSLRQLPYPQEGRSQQGAGAALIRDPHPAVGQRQPKQDNIRSLSTLLPHPNPHAFAVFFGLRLLTAWLPKRPFITQNTLFCCQG